LAIPTEEPYTIRKGHYRIFELDQDRMSSVQDSLHAACEDAGAEDAPLVGAY